MNWKFFVSMALPLLREAGAAKKAEDANATGKDDLIGTVLIFAADLIEWALSGGKILLPPVPSEMRRDD